VLNQARKGNKLRLALRQLNPVAENVVRYPVDVRICALSASLDLLVLVWFFNLVQSSCHDPVVLLGAEDLPKEAKGLCAAQDSKFLNY
jgi:hypothetical protein